MEELDIELYNFNLPKHLIAQLPSQKRSESRLLFYNREKNKVSHLIFKDILKILDENWVIVLNDTKVEPRKVYCTKPSGASVPILITHYEDKKLKFLPYKRIKLGQNLILDGIFNCVVTQKDFDTGEFMLEGDFSKCDIEKIINNSGLPPLPPYIKRKKEDEKHKVDFERYQTVFAKHGSSLAAPTAGFHFDKDLLDALVRKGIEILYITLNVGLSTFKPIRTKNLLQHRIFPEEVEVKKEVAERLNNSLNKNKKILCVGTTVVRTLEFIATKFGGAFPYKGEVDLFIYPGYKFKITSGIITNFHLPKSTNLLLVAAFIGREKLLELYEIAIKENYKFFSYGDAMLII